MNNNKGFSLVELMVVVAIIGILASIAVPNFQRFQAKTRQSEAKSKLTAIYTAEKAFHSEWNNYWSGLVTIGVEYEGVSRYHAGFNGAATQSSSGAGAATVDPNFNPAAADTPNTVGQYGGIFQNAAAHPEAPAALAAPAAGTCPAMALPAGGAGMGATFVAGANGIIYEAGNFDQWTIDQAKNLCNNRSGIQ